MPELDPSLKIRAMWRFIRVCKSFKSSFLRHSLSLSQVLAADKEKRARELYWEVRGGGTNPFVCVILFYFVFDLRIQIGKFEN